jgi:hypothetical protein
LAARRWLGLTPLAGVVFAVACGASVSEVYEGDVRFERCMALDWQGDVDPQIRKGCWEEWTRYFTLGQTRDRIEYAHRELDKLSPTSSSVATIEPTPLHAIPEPTSVFLPPPMMMNSATPVASASAAPESSAVASEKSACETACDDRAGECSKVCRGPVCSKGCSILRAKCLERCTAKR